VPEAIHIEERSGFGLATVMARKGVAREEIARALGVPPPEGPRWTAAGGLALIATGPGTWLALSAGAPETHAARLSEAVGPLASVVDQSGGYVILKLCGPGARTVLQRGAPIDLHPRAFGPGSAAVTVISHIGVVLRQLDETPAYEAAVFRSYAGSFRRWLDAAIGAL
jgi:sarcosine oxidase subunit gamma